MIYTYYKVYIQTLENTEWYFVESYDYFFNARKARKDLLPYFGVNRIKIEKISSEFCFKCNKRTKSIQKTKICSNCNQQYKFSKKEYDKQLKLGVF